MQLTRVNTNGISLELAAYGPESGRLVILLHGFPDLAESWRHQAPVLAEAGYRVLVPNQRGYGDSDRPLGVASYAVDLLARDVLGLIEAAGRERATLVAHDWGAPVACQVASMFPERIERIALLAGPHPAAMSKLLRSDWPQRWRSTYMLWFQLPWLSEWYLLRDGGRHLADAVQRASRKSLFDSDATRARYLAAWQKPGAMTAMLNWYRAGLRVHVSQRAGHIDCPALVIWGAKDAFLTAPLGAATTEYFPHGRLVTLEASHWLHLEQPTAVNELLVSFLAGTDPDFSQEA
jgi:pimeloyl-ACP methyl ester carboxylesterase